MPTKQPHPAPRSNSAHLNPKRGPVSDAQAELVYRALINAISELETDSQLTMLSTFMGMVPWAETEPPVKLFVRKLTRELGSVLP